MTKKKFDRSEPVPTVVAVSSSAETANDNLEKLRLEREAQGLTPTGRIKKKRQKKAEASETDNEQLNDAADMLGEVIGGAMNAICTRLPNPAKLDADETDMVTNSVKAYVRARGAAWVEHIPEIALGVSLGIVILPRLRKPKQIFTGPIASLPGDEPL